MEQDCIQEALSHYNITAPETELLRHNENLTYRVGKEYLLQIHEPAEGFSADFFYNGVDRIEIYRSELAFQAYLKKQGMKIREAVENRHGEFITQLQDGTYVTVSKWIEGESLDKLELNDAICYRIGEMLAHLHQKAKGFRISPVKSYGKEHCESTKRRIQALENLGLSAKYSSIMQKCCDCAREVLEKARDEFQMIHGDLSASNILQTPDGLVPIDFSFFGMGHPMYDLAVLFGNISGLVRRQQMADGYRDAGGMIRYDVLDACFIISLLDCLGIHYEQWSKHEWFAPRLQRWHKENLEPYVQGERIYADDFYLLHVQG
ncbi:MAG: phosphotransferase [Lachnospiraceae bacterium]|nr:phosphotransferase [Lachnospiraceae bacterium]